MINVPAVSARTPTLFHHPLQIPLYSYNNCTALFFRLKIPSRKKLKPAVVFEAQSCSTHGPIKVEKFFQKCEVCDLYVNSKRQWEIHISGKGGRHANFVLPTVGARIRNIQIPNPFENRTFQS